MLDKKTQSASNGENKKDNTTHTDVRVTSRFSFSEWLNSNFVVTVIGGAILWLISTYWQQDQTANQRDRQNNQQKYERQYALLTEFSADFPFTIHLARKYKTREVWIATQLKAWRDITPACMRQTSNIAIKKSTVSDKCTALEKSTYYDARSFNQTQEIYEEALRNYHKRKPPYAFAAQIKATFSNPEIHLATTKLNEHGIALQKAAQWNLIRKHSAELEDIYSQLILLMGSSLEGKEE